MSKAYWIVRVDVADAKAYAGYLAANREPLVAHGARLLVRGGPFECVEGGSRTRNILVEFPSYEAALACYRSPAYQAALQFRKPPVATADFIIVEGYDGPRL